jgi:hypothetical protein
VVLGFLSSLAGAILTIFGQWSIWPSIGLAGLVLAATGLLAVRKSWPSSALAFLQQFVVLAAYFVGRTAGIFWPFKRVQR